MAIVLPNGDLENSSLAYLRHYILSRSHVLAVVHLPLDTFVPFGTGVRASVLFLQKADIAGRQSKRQAVFFGRVTKLGYLAKKNGGAVYRKDKAGRLLTDEDGVAIVDEDVSLLVRNYELARKHAGLTESDEAFTLPAEEIADRFDLEYYKPSHRRSGKLLHSKGAKPLSIVADIVKTKAPKLAQPDEEVLYVELGNVNVEYCELSGGETMKVHELPSRASFELREGDIITAVAGNSIGTVKHMSAIVTKEYEGAICTNGFRILRPKKGINPYYLLYYLRTPYFLEQVFRYRTGAAIPAISDEDLAQLLVYVPQERTQKSIAEKVTAGFKLRQQSKQLTRSIDFFIS
jgi:type I restriction enzyme M protein